VNWISSQNVSNALTWRASIETRLWVVPRQIPSGREMAAILELKAVLQRFFNWDRNMFPSCGVIESRLNAPQLDGSYTSPSVYPQCRSGLIEAQAAKS
jgi:hypothetical protein